MKNRSGGILALGHVLMDVFGELPENPGESMLGAGVSHLDREAIDGIQKIIGSLSDDCGVLRRVGGGQALLAIAARALGIETRLFACVGGDEEGTQVRSWLDGYGVGSDILTREGRTGVFICLIGERGKKGIFVDAGAARNIRGTRIGDGFLQPGWILSLDGLLIDSLPWLEETAERAKNAGLRIALDLSTPSNVLEHGNALREFAGRYCDFVFSNELEFNNLQGSAGKILTPRETWIVKLGATGVRSIRGKDSWSVEAKPEDSGFDTGAGDFFAAGYLAGKLAGLGEVACLSMGNAAAAKLVRKGKASLPLEDLASLGRVHLPK